MMMILGWITGHERSSGKPRDRQKGVRKTILNINELSEDITEQREEYSLHDLTEKAAIEQKTFKLKLVLDFIC